jgi:hypothetical protein
MKAKRLTLVLIFAAALFFSGSHFFGSERDDHLIPADSLFQKYRELLASKLGQTPFNCGRVFIEPAFEPESAISVYCGSPAGVGQKCKVTYTKASENFWQSTSALQEADRATRVKIARIDAEISASTALLVRTAFFRILKLTRPHVAREGEMRSLTTDATRTEFSLEVPGAPQLWGELDISLVGQGKDIKRVLTLGRLLIDYCKANQRDKPKIERAIRTRAVPLGGAGQS